VTINQDKQTDNPNVLLAALEFLAEGVAVVPAAGDGSKRPLGNWKEFQTRQPEATEVLQWATTAQGFGVITGAVSGNLEMLELEGRAVAADLHTQARELAYASGLDLLWEMLASTYIEATPSGGLHWLYRISDHEVPGNTKLARRPGENGGVDVLAETRGEGGFCIVAPSGGTTHPSGDSWERLNGSTPKSIQTITWEQREAIHAIFKMLDAMPNVELVQTAIQPKDPDGRLSPGDDYNNRTSWDDILTDWTKVYQRGGETFWRRPGKDVGISASTGRGDTDNLYVWTTSTQFESEKPYSKFAAWTLINYGDTSQHSFSMAAKQLRQMGYGDISVVQEQRLNDFMPGNLIDVNPFGERQLDNNGEPVDQDDPLFKFELLNAKIRRQVKRTLDDQEILATFRPPTFVRSLADELQQPEPEQEWVINELLPQNANVLLTAAYKSGKTTMVNNLVKSLVDDEPFLDTYGVQPHDGRVVIFNYEVDPRQYRQWLREMNIRNLDKITIVHLRGLRMPMIVEHIEDKIVDMLAELECQTWIIDPFARAFVGSGEENSNSDVGRFLDTIDVIKDRAGVHNMVMPAHTGRSTDDGGMVRARGATRLDDHADVRWLMSKTEDGDRFFAANGRDVELSERLLDFNPETRKLAFHRDLTKYEIAIEHMIKSMTEYVGMNPNCTATELTDNTKGNTNLKSPAKEKAVKDGKIVEKTYGRSKVYVLPQNNEISRIESIG